MGICFWVASSCVFCADTDSFLCLQILLDGKGSAYTSTLEQYRVKAEYFLCAALQKNNGANIIRSPGKMSASYIELLFRRKGIQRISLEGNNCLSVRIFVLGNICCLST